MRTIVARFSSLTFSELILITILGYLVMFLAAHLSGYKSCVNYRAEFALYNNTASTNSVLSPNKGFLIQFEECLETPTCSLRDLVSADDIAGPLLLWAGYKIEHAGKKLPQNTHLYRDPTQHPLITKFIYHIFHTAFLILFCFFAWNTLGPIVTLFGGIALSFFENFFFITFSYDVYVFPLYALFLTLIFLRPSKFRLYNFVLVGFLVGLCSWFRSNSWMIFSVAAIISLCFLWKNFRHHLDSIKKILICLALSVLTAQLPNMFFSTGKHPFWHPLHAGLFEHGGFVYSDISFVPRHLASSLRPQEKPIQEFYSWSDQIQYNIVFGALGKAAPVGSKRYEEVLKDDYLRLWSAAPIKNILFYLSRIPVVFSLNPFKKHRYTDTDETPYSLETKFYSSFYSLLFFLLLAVFLLSKKFTLFEKCFFTGLILITSTTGLLVHPGLIIYNAPLLFTQWLLIFSLISRSRFFSCNDKHDVK